MANTSAVIPKSRKRKADLNPDSLSQLSKEDLIRKISNMQTHIDQLRRIIAKAGNSTVISFNCEESQVGRAFDFSKYVKRHVLLHILYFGWDYNGFVVQEDTHQTVEHYLFEALLKTKLIESRQTSNYHRCGRTDKGVSAFGQVISIDVRSSKLLNDNESKENKEEIDYCFLLNKVLPDGIRVVAWADSPSFEFSARFDCSSRTYRYYFPRGNLDVAAMEDAVCSLVGYHDFRNLCKMDVGNGVEKFERCVDSVNITRLNNGWSFLHIQSKGFLWHQIRCILSVLVLIGQGKERVDIFDRLFDINKSPARPQYTLASDLPLCFWDCEFSTDDPLVWKSSHKNTNILLSHLTQAYAKNKVKSIIIKKMMQEITKNGESEKGIVDATLSEVCFKERLKTYKPLFERPTCDSLETRIRKRDSLTT